MSVLKKNTNDIMNKESCAWGTIVSCGQGMLRGHLSINLKKARG